MTARRVGRRALPTWPGLDGLRAVAVAVVFLIHLPMRSWRGGSVGVDVFFALSGFLITTVLCADADRVGHVDVRSFYFRRLVRLYPAMLLGLVVAAVVVVASDTFQLGSFLWDALSSIAYVFNVRLAVGQPRTVVGQFWSLSVEEQFYLVWAPMVMLVQRRIGLGVRALQVATASLVAVALAKLAWAVVAPPRTGIYVYVLLPGHADELLLGAVIALALRTGMLERMPARLRRSALVPTAALIAIVLGSWRLPDRPSPWYVGGGWLLFAAFGGVIIVHVVCTPESWFTRALSSPWLGWVGRRSYAIYLVHVAIIRGTVELFGRRLLVVAPLSLVVTLVVAGLSWRFVEEPALRWHDRRRTAALEGSGAAFGSPGPHGTGQAQPGDPRPGTPAL